MRRTKIATIAPRVAQLDTAIAPTITTPSDPIYNTAEYARWRAAVIDASRGMCQGLNCGKVGGRLFADHIVELKDNGAPFDPANGQALCGRCHSRKTAAERAKRFART